MTVVYVEQTPWASLVAYRLHEQGYTIEPYSKETNYPKGTNLVVRDADLDLGGILITPNYFRIPSKGQGVTVKGGVDGLLNFLFRGSNAEWVVKYASDYRMYVILHAYGVRSYNYMRTSFTETLELNKDLLDMYHDGFVRYRNNIQHDYVAGYNAVVVRDSPYNLALTEWGDELVVAILRKNGRPYLHATGEHALKYAEHMKQQGMKSYVVDDSRGAYLFMPGFDDGLDDIAVSDIKQTVKGFYTQHDV